MSKVIFTPWKTQTQLLAVRSQFYPPPTYNGADMRFKACAMVESWKLRGNLPHPIEATALLTDAILHDDASKNSIFSIRATYAAAFCRFVTGLVDKLHGQKKTMFQRAIDLSLPASFVELRHEATHRELPSLIVLRNAAQRSLEWLWDYYWVKIDANSPVSGLDAPMAVGGDDEVRRTVLGALRELDGGEGNRRRVMEVRGGVVERVGSICKDFGGIVARVLVEVMVPERLDSLDEQFTKWDEFLQMLINTHPAFLTSLTEEMANDLAFTTEKNHCEGVSIWLDHILTSKQWKSSRRFLSIGYTLAICEESPNTWTNLLKEKVQRIDLSDNVKQAVANTAHETIMTDDQDLSKYGWSSLDTWDSRPLGVV